MSKKKLTILPCYFADKYKFHLAFENAVCDDYFTEKLVRPFHLGAIPIFYGSKNVRDFAPRRNAFVIGGVCTELTVEFLSQNTVYCSE